MLIYAAALLNPDQPPLREPALWIRGDTLAYVGSCEDLPLEAENDPEIVDLGEVTIFPGLVNAHAHLELTAMQGLSYPGAFVAWIQTLLEKKTATEPEAMSQSFQDGLRQSLRGGTTCVGDHVSVGTDLQTLLRSPLRGRAFLEILGVVPEVGQDLFHAARQLVEINESGAHRFRVIPSPHSVHALAPEVLAQVLSLEEPVFSIHLAESQAELDYFANRSGPLQDLIASRGQVPGREAKSAVRELASLGKLNDRLLAVHGNYLDPEEIQQLAQAGASLVHCPFSHGYFGHGPFPLSAAKAAGLNISLGTDSLASASTLSMLEVMREMEREFPELKREEIFAMATIQGAKALHLASECGSLEVGKKADLIAVPSAGSHPLDALFRAEVVESLLIGGQFVTDL